VTVGQNHGIGMVNAWCKPLIPADRDVNNKSDKIKKNNNKPQFNIIKTNLNNIILYALL